MTTTAKLKAALCKDAFRPVWILSNGPCVFVCASGQRTASTRTHRGQEEDKPEN